MKGRKDGWKGRKVGLVPNLLAFQLSLFTLEGWMEGKEKKERKDGWKDGIYRCKT